MEDVYQAVPDYETFYKIKYYSYKYHPLFSPHMISLIRRRKNWQEYRVENYSNFGRPGLIKKRAKTSIKYKWNRKRLPRVSPPWKSKPKKIPTSPAVRGDL